MASPDDPPVVLALGQLRARAEHPQGYRLYDLRPDLLGLLDVVDAVFAEHVPVPAHPGEPPTLCGSCACELRFCKTRRVLAGHLARMMANRPTTAPASSPDGRG